MTRAVWIAVILLAIIGIVTATHRAGALLTRESADPKSPIPEGGFFAHRLLTLVHVIPGLLFMILGPLQFVRGLRSRRPRLHRWCGRVFVAAGLVIGTSALRMSFLKTIGGANETAATTLFAIVFLVSLVKAFIHVRRCEFALHREWMLRAFAIGLAVATIRPIVGIFFAFRRLSPREFFGIAFWIGFTLHFIAAEIWINYTRSRLEGARATLLPGG
jgi:uncharacterized membrane protein